jgi:hypothetical protein
LHKVERGALAKDLDVIRRIEPERDPQQPPAPGTWSHDGRLLASIEVVPAAPPFVGTDQAAVLQLAGGLAPQRGWGVSIRS